MSGLTEAHIWRQLFTRQPLPADPAGEIPLPTIRLARPEDEEALSELAQLDSSRPPRGLVVVAEVEGALWAAASVDDFHVVSDPLRPAGDLAWRALERARRLRGGRDGDRRRGGARVWPRALDARRELADA